MNEKIIYCPNCLLRGSKNKLINFQKFYSCESRICKYTKDKDGNEDSSTTQELLKTKINDSNTDKYSQNCPDCKKSGKLSPIVLRGQCYFCENIECFFCEERELFENSKISFENGSDESFEIVKLNPDILKCHDINNSTTKDDLIYDNEGSEELQDQINEIFWKPSQKMFNWTNLPCFMKAHTKIFYILLIHLDVLLLNNASRIENIKKEYSACNAFANNYKLAIAKLTAFNFISKLFDIVSFIPKKELQNKEMDDRLIKTLRSYFTLFDYNKEFSIHFSVTTTCPHCLEHRIENLNDYFIPLEMKTIELKLTNNEIRYKIVCVVCKNLANKFIKLYKVPQFVIFHCPNGVSSKYTRLEKGLLSEKSSTLKLVGVVECKDKFPYADCKESEINYVDFCNLLTTNVVKQNFDVHFKNSDGWYNFSYKKPFLCLPTKSPDIKCDKDIRLLILGDVTDSRKYCQKFSFQQYQKMHRTEKVKELKRIFSQTEDETLSKKAIQIYKRSKRTSLKYKIDFGSIKVNEHVSVEDVSVPSYLLNEDEVPESLGSHIISAPESSSSILTTLQQHNASSNRNILTPISYDVTQKKVSAFRQSEISNIDFMISEIAKKIK